MYSPDEKVVEHLRASSSAHVNELIEVSGLPRQEGADMLVKLELREIIHQLPRRRYRLHQEEMKQWVSIKLGLI